jgi:predicted metalloprotease with PDZ domain
MLRVPRFVQLAALCALFALVSGSTGRAADVPKLGVKLILEQDPALRLQIEVTARGDEDGETLFSVSPDWGGVPIDRVDLVEPRATSESGSPLQVKAISNFSWSVQHAPGERVTFGASLLPNERRKTADSADHYRPILEETLFQAIAHVFLPLPELDGGGDDLVSLGLTFEGFYEAQWQVVHSLGLGDDDLQAELTRERLSGLLFAAGELEVYTRQIRGGLLAFSISGDQWLFDGEEFADLVAEIIDLERNYLDDDSAPFYWVGAIQVGDPQAARYSFGGTGLTNSFALFLQPNTMIGASSPVGPQIRKLLAHECFHEWNGLRIRMGQPEEQNYWFSEGFTEYFARRILYENELISEQTYVEWINTTLHDYHVSSARNLPASKLAKIFWTTEDGQRQPYLRGELMAMIVEHAIRKTSNGRQGLNDLMRSLLQEAEQEGPMRFGSERLLDRIGRFTGSDIIPSLRAICVDGSTAVLPSDVLGSGFVLESTTGYRFEAGFDWDATLKTRRVTGVVQGGVAEKAGMNEGDEILALSIEPGKANLPVSASVRTGSDAEVRKIEFLPRGNPIQIPVLKSVQ